MRKNATSAAVAELRPAVGSDQSIVMLTTAQLQAIIQNSVIAALAEFKATERPDQATLSGAELAVRLGLSRTRIHHLRQTGMPAIRVGEIYRYELAPCLAWLRERGRDGGEAP
jgi:hypothetical protein